MSYGIKFWIISFSEAAKPLLCDLDYSLKEMVHVVGIIFLLIEAPSPPSSLSLSFLFPPFSVNHSPLRLS